MALIKCPECDKDISDTIKKCPNCGYKFKKEINKKYIVIISIIVIAVIIGSVITTIILSNNKKQAEIECIIDTNRRTNISAWNSFRNNLL